MMAKKGVSQAIMFVLLVGFAVLVGVIVMAWSMRHTEELTEYGIDFVEDSLECDKIEINVRYTLGQRDCSDLTVKNVGYIKADRLITRISDEDKAEVIPVIKMHEDNREVGCKEKAVVLECDVPLGFDFSSVEVTFHDVDLMPKEEISVVTGIDPPS